MRLINFMLVVKTLTFIKDLYIQITINMYKLLITPIVPQSQKFTCIQVQVKVKRTGTVVIFYCQLQWIGQWNYGTLKIKKNQFILLKVHKNMCMMFSGVLYIQVFSVLVMVMDTSIFGTSIRTPKLQLLERRLDREH